MDYNDKPYDVAQLISLAAGDNLSDFPIEIRNPSAPWFWTGTIYVPVSGSGKLNLTVMDAMGRALATTNVPIEAFAGISQDAPVGTPEQYLQWPMNSRLRLRLSETSGTDPVSAWVCFRGFQRYRRIAAC